MKFHRIESGYYETATPSGTRLVIFQVSARFNQYGKRRKNPRAGNPWRVRNPAIDGPASIIAEEWTLAAAKYAAENYASKEKS
jgi:hypothetical protein